MLSAHRSRLSSVDTAWLRMDRPDNPMTIVSVMATETPLALAAFRRLLEERFLCFPRFRQRPVMDALGASWVDDDGFDVGAHVVTATLPRPGGARGLQLLAAQLASTPLDRRRPLWQVHFVKRYRGGSAIVFRIHHCYADGIAMIRVLLSMTEADGANAGAPAGPGGRGRPARRSTVDLLPVIDWVAELPTPMGGWLSGAMTQGVRMLETVIRQALHPEQAALRTLQAGGVAGELARVLAMPDDPVTPLRGKLSGRKVVAWGEPLPLTDVKTIAKALDCTINDVLMSTIAGALGAYLRSRGHDTKGLGIRATVPVNLRPPGGPSALGNQFGLVFVELPLGVRNPLQRVYALHDTMVALKGSMQPPMVLGMLGLLGRLPAALQSPAIELFSRKATAVVSNVPGPRSKLTLAGQRVSQMLFWVPQSGSIGIGISVLTYAGRVHFGLVADERLIPEPQNVIDRFGPEFENLLLAVTVGALATRHPDEPPPGRKRRRSRARPGHRPR